MVIRVDDALLIALGSLVATGRDRSQRKPVISPSI